MEVTQTMARIGGGEELLVSLQAAGQTGGAGAVLYREKIISA